jgi:hypothetical protein
LLAVLTLLCRHLTRPYTGVLAWLHPLHCLRIHRCGLVGVWRLRWLRLILLLVLLCCLLLRCLHLGGLRLLALGMLLMSLCLLVLVMLLLLLLLLLLESELLGHESRGLMLTLLHRWTLAIEIIKNRDKNAPVLPFCLPALLADGFG